MATVSRFSHNIANKHLRRVVKKSSSWSTSHCRLLQHSQHNRRGITTQELRRKRGMLQGLVVQDLCSHSRTSGGSLHPTLSTQFDHWRAIQDDLSIRKQQKEGSTSFMLTAAQPTRQGKCHGPRALQKTTRIQCGFAEGRQSLRTSGG